MPTIKINKSDIKNSVIINSNLTQILINIFNIDAITFSDIQVRKTQASEANQIINALKKFKHTVTIDTGNTTGILIYTFINNTRKLLYYNYSVFVILNKDLSIYPIELFNNHIFSVQKIQSLAGEREREYFVIYESLTKFPLELICYSSDIYIKTYHDYKHIKSIVEDYIPMIPIKVYGLLFVPSNKQYKCISILIK